MNQTLIAIGEALIDFTPLQQGQALKDVSSFVRNCGGAPINIAAAVSKLGGNAKVITQLGADPFGDYIIETLEQCHVDISAIKRTALYPTGLAFVSLAADGNRDFTFYRNPSADLFLSPQDITPQTMKECSILHFCSVALVESPMKEAHRKAIALAKDQGAIISFDPNVRLPLWNSEQACKNAILEFAPYADILKISEDELPFLTGHNNIETALSDFPNAKLLLYTCGAKGSQLVTANSIYRQAPLAVKAVDTTGAGDAFAAAFLYQLLKDHITRQALPQLSDKKLQTYLQFANAYAANSTLKHGAVNAMATLSELNAFMQTHHTSQQSAIIGKDS